MAASMSVRLALLAALLGAACSSGAPDPRGPADGAGSDGAAGSDAGQDGAQDAGADSADVSDGDAAGGDAADGADVPSVPVACGAEQACNRGLDNQGLCPGTCLAQPRMPHCPRAPLHGLCHPEAAPEPSSATVTVGDLVVTPLQAPSAAKTGDVASVVFALQRKPGAPAGSPISAQIQGKAGKHWTLWGIGQGQAKVVEVGDAAVLVSVTVKAIGWDLLDHAHEVAVLTVNGVDVPSYAVLSYAGADAIACGGFAFPPNSNPCGAEPCSVGYPQGRCCGGVFYPSAACCADADCPVGVCADGRCIRRVPDNVVGRSLMSGHLRVLWVVGGEPSLGGADLCTDRTAELGATLGLAKTEAVFSQILAKRLGQGAEVKVRLTLQWKVLAGLQQAAIDGGSEPTFAQWRQTVQAALQASGCSGADFADFDVVILSRPNLYLEGYAGHVYPGGFVGLRQVGQPRLTAHEIMHTFGASDLYGDVAAQLHWNQALMGTNTYGDGPLSDDVTWAEVGLGDIDRDGVVDLAQFASEPESLQLASLKAVLDKGPTLYLKVEIGALEAGKARALYFDASQVSVALLAAGEAKAPDAFSHTAAFDGAALAKAGVAVGAKVQVRVTASHVFSGAGFVRKTLTLDTTTEVAVSGP